MSAASCGGCSDSFLVLPADLISVEVRLNPLTRAELKNLPGPPPPPHPAPLCKTVGSGGTPEDQQHRKPHLPRQWRHFCCQQRVLRLFLVFCLFCFFLGGVGGRVAFSVVFFVLLAFPTQGAWVLRRAPGYYMLLCVATVAATAATVTVCSRYCGPYCFAQCCPHCIQHCLFCGFAVSECCCPLFFPHFCVPCAKLKDDIIVLRLCGGA